MREKIDYALTRAEQLQSSLNQEVLDIPGLTSYKVKHFLNNIVSDGDHYCEVGSFRGATLISACFNNNITATSIEDRSQADISPATRDFEVSFTDEAASELYNNTIKYTPNQVKFVAADVNKLKEGDIDKKIDVLFYDGAHDLYNQSRLFKNFYEHLSDQAIVIVDDWNWLTVRDGTVSAFRSSPVKIKYKKLIRTSINEDPSDFWNGLGIFYVEK